MLGCKLLLYICYIQDADDEEPTKRSLQNRRQTLEEAIRASELELQEIDVHLESMEIIVPQLSSVGKQKVVCSNCHHRGHRNQQTKPCILEKCSSYTYCGIKDKHPEYFSKMNQLKSSLNKKKGEVKNLKEELESVNNFQSQSEFQFIKALTPRMMRVNHAEYKMNRLKLLRDIRVLRQFFGGKIPDETTNDPEQLRITLSKCKSSLENDVGDVGVVGIEEYEKRQATSSGVNLNVHMNLTPVKNKMKDSKINVRNNLEVGTDAGNVNDTRKAKRSKGKKKSKKQNLNDLLLIIMAQRLTSITVHLPVHPRATKLVKSHITP